MVYSFRLKGCFLLHSVSSESQFLLAFEMTDPVSGITQQYTWTVSPKGFQVTPHLFGNALAKQPRELQLKNGAVLQYVDDILICSLSREDSDENTIQVLNFSS